MEEAHESFQQREEYQITDLDTFKILAHPVRFKVLSALAHEPRTVKQVAADLRMPPTRLYRHIKVLLAHHLIAVVRTQVVSGIVERHYQAVARTMLSPRATLMGEHPPDTILPVVFDATTRRAEDAVSRAVEAGVIDLEVRAPHPRALLLRRGEARLTSAQAARVSAALVTLVEGAGDDDGDGDDDDDRAWAGEARWYDLLIGLYPTVEESAPGRAPLRQVGDTRTNTGKGKELA